MFEDDGFGAFAKFKKLKGTEDYPAWRHLLYTYLLLYGLTGIVDGRDKEPFLDAEAVDTRTDSRAGMSPPRALTDTQQKKWETWAWREEKTTNPSPSSFVRSTRLALCGTGLIFHISAVHPSANFTPN